MKQKFYSDETKIDETQVKQDTHEKHNTGSAPVHFASLGLTQKIFLDF